MIVTTVWRRLQTHAVEHARLASARNKKTDQPGMGNQTGRQGDETPDGGRTRCHAVRRALTTLLHISYILPTLFLAASLMAASFFACVSVGAVGACQPPPSARIRLTVERARSPSSCTAARCCCSTVRSA